jgi:hypothetical protein
MEVGLGMSKPVVTSGVVTNHSHCTAHGIGGDHISNQGVPLASGDPRLFLISDKLCSPHEGLAEPREQY